MSPLTNNRNASPTATNKPNSNSQNHYGAINANGTPAEGASRSYHSPPTPGHPPMANGGSPRANVQSMGSVVNIGMDTIPKDGYPNGMRYVSWILHDSMGSVSLVSFTSGPPAKLPLTARKDSFLSVPTRAAIEKSYLKFIWFSSKWLLVSK